MIVSGAVNLVRRSVS